MRLKSKANNLLQPTEMPPSRWSMARDLLTRPYRVPIPMLLLMAMIPFYIFIPVLMPVRTLHTPELAVDRALPVQPVWALLYGAFYLYLIVLPVLLARQEELIRRMYLSYLTVWIIAYIFFLIYPTVASRPKEVIGEDFAAWGLRLLYSADPPYNCFPSLHVAHSFVSAMTCYRVHRKLGIATIACAFLVGISTLFTKQHYVLDVIAGILLAGVAYFIFLRNGSEKISEADRNIAPFVALCVLGIVALIVACFWFIFASRLFTLM